jgi:hypothetical protein
MNTVEQLRAAKALSATQVQILQHSLGLTYGGAMYRNHFCTNEGTIDYPGCIALVNAGYMTRRKGSQITGGDDVFYVTDAGKDLCRAIADAEQSEVQDA